MGHLFSESHYYVTLPHITMKIIAYNPRLQEERAIPTLFNIFTLGSKNKQQESVWGEGSHRTRHRGWNHNCYEIITIP